jgi:hypothetical protein
LAQAVFAPIRDGDIDRDTVEPGFDRRVWLPRAPPPVSAFEGVLSAVFRGRRIAEQRDQGAQDPAVRVPVEPFEIRLRPRLVMDIFA